MSCFSFYLSCHVHYQITNVDIASLFASLNSYHSFLCCLLHGFLALVMKRVMTIELMLAMIHGEKVVVSSLFYIFLSSNVLCVISVYSIQQYQRTLTSSLVSHTIALVMVDVMHVPMLSTLSLRMHPLAKLERVHGKKKNHSIVLFQFSVPVYFYFISITASTNIARVIHISSLSLSSHGENACSNTRDNIGDNAW